MIAGRDYVQLGLAGSDFKSICMMGSKLDQVRRIRKRFIQIPAWRITESFRSFLQHWVPKTPDYHSSDLQAEAHAALVKPIGDSVASGKVRELDLDLAAKVATGALSSDALVDSLVTTFLQTLESAWTPGKVRKTSSQWVDQDALIEAVRTLGRGEDMQAMLARFRISPKALPGLSLDCGEALPDSFMSLKDPAILGKSYLTVQRLLKACGQRLHIVLDETTWSPDFQQVRKFKNGEDLIIGGCWDPSGGPDYSCLKPADHVLHTLDKEMQAKTALHLLTDLITLATSSSAAACRPGPYHVVP